MPTNKKPKNRLKRLLANQGLNLKNQSACHTSPCYSLLSPLWHGSLREVLRTDNFGRLPLAVAPKSVPTCIAFLYKCINHHIFPFFKECAKHSPQYSDIDFGDTGPKKPALASRHYRWTGRERVDASDLDPFPKGVGTKILVFYIFFFIYIS